MEQRASDCEGAACMWLLQNMTSAQPDQLHFIWHALHSLHEDAPTRSSGRGLHLLSRDVQCCWQSPPDRL